MKSALLDVSQNPVFTSICVKLSDHEVVPTFGCGNLRPVAWPSTKEVTTKPSPRTTPDCLNLGIRIICSVRGAVDLWCM